MTPAAARRIRRALLALALLDWALPFGLLNGLFNKYRLFPTNLTRIFAEHLMSPETFAATWVVSASAPLFWVMGGFCVSTLVRCLRAWREGSPVKMSLTALLLGQFLFFVLPEILLPWMDALRLLPHRLMDVFFPATPRGHGRFYEWLHLPGALLFALSRRVKSPVSPS